MAEGPLLHLDDRLLHGRILHGWGGRLRITRYLLITREPLAAARQAGFREAAREVGAALCAHAVAREPSAEARQALDAQAEGDFWLCDSPAAALGMIWWGRSIGKLRIVGLRDEAGISLGEEYRFAPRSLRALRALALAGVELEARPFPDAAELHIEKLMSLDDQ